MKKLLEYLQTRYTSKTAKAYQREIDIFILNYAHLIGGQAQSAQYKDLIAYLGYLRNRYDNAKTLMRILSSMKAYYDYLQELGQREDNPSKSIKLRDKQSKDVQLQDLFTEEELESLLHRKERYSALEYRNKVLMSLLIYQGLKPDEIAQITLHDINLKEATIYVKGSGKNNSRELSLKPTQILLFYDYQISIRPKLLKKQEQVNSTNSTHLTHSTNSIHSINTIHSTSLFLLSHRGVPMKGEDITKHVKRSFEGLYSPRKVNCQRIRQSVISNLLRSGKELRMVQVFAGHKSPSTTERYKQSSEESLRIAIARYHPLE